MITILDVETTIKNKGNPYTRSNSLVNTGIYQDGTNYIYYEGDVDNQVQTYLDKATVIVGFNLKFDLAWLRRYKYDFSHCTVWDCQLADFLIEGQATPYPSLNKVAEKYGLGSKLDIIKTEYWDKGIDTTDIPRATLTEYLLQDLSLTKQVMEKQVEQLTSLGLMRLFKLQCHDLLCLLDMEWNGMKFDVDKAALLAAEELEKVSQYESILRVGYDDIPINWNSRDHLSCFLYGGRIVHEDRLEIGVYKTGTKTGLPRYKKIEYNYDLPKLVEPPKGSELIKEGYYATDDGTLRSLKTTRENRSKLDAILARAKANKLVGTYFKGLPELITTMDWDDGYLHGNFNQCVAATGRLSSSRPNLQNFADDCKQLLISRYIC